MKSLHLILFVFSFVSYSWTQPIEETNNATQMDTRDPLSLCGDWQQLGVKCYKFIDVLTNKNDAKEQCKRLDKSSSLVQIGSKQEMDDILAFLKTYKRQSIAVQYQSRDTKRTVHSNSSVVNNVWLGINYHLYDQYNNPYDGHYLWEDSTSLEYTNWDEDSPDTRATNLCVQSNMESGKWSDIKCTKRNLVLCQKANELTLNNLYQAVRHSYSNLNERISQLNDVVIYQGEVIGKILEQINQSKNQ